VPNPSFEDTLGCPDGIAQIGKLTYWTIFNNSTPDYFNVCANLHPVSQAFGIPDNFTGYQFPHSGIAYCGEFNSYGGWNIQRIHRGSFAPVIT